MTSNITWKMSSGDFGPAMSLGRPAEVFVLKTINPGLNLPYQKAPFPRTVSKGRSQTHCLVILTCCKEESSPTISITNPRHSPPWLSLLRVLVFYDLLLCVSRAPWTTPPTPPRPTLLPGSSIPGPQRLHLCVH